MAPWSSVLNRRFAAGDPYWDAEAYDTQAAYVLRAGESLIDLLAPRPSERILDLGCGTGHLTSQIAARGAQVLGIDVSTTMVERARANYPALDFRVVDAAHLRLAEPVDAVFSNAALHWIPRSSQLAVLAGVHRILEPGGRFVAELGGQGNVQRIVRALEDALAALGYTHGRVANPWYFPTPDAYARLLEKAGLRVRVLELFDRPTPFDGGENGMRHWLELFASDFISPVSPPDREHLVREVERRLRPELYRAGIWTGDYRRLRLVAVKD